MTKRNINGGVVRWRGDGGTAYVPGVPQRDLTAAEWEELPVALQHTARATGLYELAEGAADAAADKSTVEPVVKEN